MKFLKALLVIVLILLVGYLVACFFGPKRMDISAGKMIGAPQETIYGQVAHLPTWEKWNTYSQMEGIEITYSNKKEGEGASYSWTMQGEPGGNLKIVDANPNSSLRVQLEFANWDGYSYVDYKFQPQGDSTKVSWNMTNDSDTPFYLRGMMWAMEGSVKADFNKSLEGLEELSESAPKTPISTEYEIIPMKRPERAYLGIRNEMSIDSLQGFYENSYSAIMEHIQQNQYEIIGAPVGVYYKWDMENNNTDLAAATPVAGDGLIGNDTLKVIEIPAGNSLVINYYGAYSDLMKPHETLNKHIEEKGLEYVGPVIEEYVTDPMNEPDTTKWQTNIVYYVE